MHDEIDPLHANANEVGIGNRTHIGRKGRTQQIQPCDLVLPLPQSTDKSLSEMAGASSYENPHRDDKPPNACYLTKSVRCFSWRLHLLKLSEKKRRLLGMIEIGKENERWR